MSISTTQNSNWIIDIGVHKRAWIFFYFTVHRHLSILACILDTNNNFLITICIFFHKCLHQGVQNSLLHFLLDVTSDCNPICNISNKKTVSFVDYYVPNEQQRGPSQVQTSLSIVCIQFAMQCKCKHAVPLITRMHVMSCAAICQFANAVVVILLKFPLVVYNCWCHFIVKSCV